MEYRIILPGGAWEEAGQQLADIYYTSAYYAMSTLVQGGEARCFHFVHRGMEAYYPFLQQAIPGTGLSDLQGAYGYNGVSCRKYDTDFQKAFHHQFSHYCEREGIVAEFTRFHPLSDNAAFSEGYLSVYRQRNTVGVDLSQGYEKVWNESYSTNNRNEIRRAAREGLCVEEAGSLAEYHAFAALYRQLMQERGAEDFFLWPDAYFSAAYALPPGERYLLLARSRDQVVGGALFLCHGNMAHYHLAARDTNFNMLPVANVLLDEGIRQATQRACLWMHLGGGLSASDQDPLLAFKRKFSRTLFSFSIGTRIHREADYQRLNADWERRNPEKAGRSGAYFLKYRLP